MGTMENGGNAGEGGVSRRLPVQTGPTGGWDAFKTPCFREEQSPKAPVLCSAFEERFAICEHNLPPAQAAH